MMNKRFTIIHSIFNVLMCCSIYFELYYLISIKTFIFGFYISSICYFIVFDIVIIFRRKNMNVSGTRVYLYFSSLGLLLSLLTIFDSFGNN